MSCVVRDDKRGFVRARSEKARGGMPPLEAEAWSFRAALLWLKEWMTQSAFLS